MFALGLATTALLAGCGEPAAPPTSALPLIPGARIVASAAGGSTIDTASDHKRYRFVVIGGPPGGSGARLLAAEVALARASGWVNIVSTVSRFVHGEVVDRPAPVTTPGAFVDLDAADHKVHASLAWISGPYDAGQDTDGSPLQESAAVAAAAARHAPLVWAELGNGPL